MKSKSGKFVVFHRCDCPFAKPGVAIPRDFMAEDNPWFFMPADGNPTAIGSMRGYPMIYSPGFASEGEALAAAEAWEIKKPDIDKEQETANKSFWVRFDMNSK